MKRKHLCWSHSFTKLQAWRLQKRCFPRIIAQFLGTAFLWNTSGDCFWCRQICNHTWPRQWQNLRGLFRKSCFLGLKIKMDFLHWGSKTPLEGCFYVIHYVVLKIIYSFLWGTCFIKKFHLKIISLLLMNEKQTNIFVRKLKSYWKINSAEVFNI